MSLDRLTQIAVLATVLVIAGFAVGSRDDKANESVSEPQAASPASVREPTGAARPTTSSKPAVSVRTATIWVFDEAGERVRLQLTDHSPVVVMASWCPKSEALVKELADPRIQPYVADLDMIFLFKRDEFATLDPKAAAEGKHGLYDPSMVGRLKGRVYYFEPADNVVFNGTPLFHRSGNVFDVGRGTWFYRHANVPGPIVDAVFAQHEPKG